MGMLTRRKEAQRFNSRVALAVSGRLLLYRQQTPSGKAAARKPAAKKPSAKAPAAKAPAAKKAPATTKTGRLRASAVRVIRAADS
jgi:hypothetical protein